MVDITLDVMHASMQFSDSKLHVEHDAKAIFARAARRKIDWITGTEAGENPVLGALKKQAETYGYSFREFKSLWVSVNRDVIAKGSLSHEEFTIVDNDLTVGKGHDTSLLAAHFTHTEVGKTTAMVCHYPRFGRPDARDPQYKVNLKWNKKAADFIGDKAREWGKGTAIVFYAGDQNIPDSVSDTFFGNPLTSLGDELHKYPNTGHGPIDVIASYDYDRRVRGVYFRALNDKTFPLYTDHYPVEGGFSVRVKGTSTG